MENTVTKFQKAVDYAKSNPNSTFATELRRRIEAGEYDKEAKAIGFTYQKPKVQQEGQTGIKGVATGAAKGFATTTLGVGEIGAKVMRPIEKLADKITGKETKTVLPTKEEFDAKRQALKPKSPAEKVGFFAEQIGEFFIPAGKVAEVEKALSTGQKASKIASILQKVGVPKAEKIAQTLVDTGSRTLTRAGEGAAITAAQTGADPEAVQAGAIGGGVFGALAPAIQKVGAAPFKLVKNVARRVAGGLSKGTKVIDAIIDNPKAALEGLNTENVETLIKNQKELSNAVKGIQKRASIDYELGLSTIDDAYKSLGINPNAPEYFFEISNKLGNAADEIISDRNINVVGGKLDFSSSPFTGTEETIIQRAYDMFSKHDDFSARGLETLAQKLGKLKKASPDFRETNQIIQKLINTARDAVQEKARLAGIDDIGDMTRKYAIAQDKIDLYKTLFGTKKGIESSTDQARTAKRLSQLFSGQKDIEQKALEDLGLQDIMAREAGRLMREEVSRNVSSIGDAVRTAVSAVIPPKTIARIVANTSLAGDKLQKFVTALESLSPAVRGSIIESLTKD